MTMAKPNYPYSMLIDARRHSHGNWDDLNRCMQCGCYSCGTIFLSNDIYNWIGLDARNIDNATAICPFCGANTVIPDSSVYPLKKDFLEYLKNYCMKEESRIPASDL